MLCLGAAFSCLAHAHPVSYQGSYPVTFRHEARKSEAILIYSIKHWWGVGGHAFRVQDKTEETQALFAKTTFLLKRWNKLGSQANIYAWLGAGSMWARNDANFAYLAGIRADYETRRILIAGNYRKVRDVDSVDYDFAQVQFGIAPFLAKYDQLHAWLLLRMNYTPDLITEIGVLPMLRFFYRNVFWEMGANQKGDWMFNAMVHF